MNLRIVTGYLPRHADPAFTPPAEGAAPVRKLVFELMVKDSHGLEWPEKCVIEDPALQKAHEAKLVAGAAVLIEGEPHARPYFDRGVQKGFSRHLRVARVEFMRLPKAAGEAAA